jgi:DHA2 family multidrug resistance protein-like MFS transporter
VVGTIAITTVLGVLDSTISNVALPTIAQDLNVSSATVIWVVNAFQLATAMLIVPLASCGDIFGFARIFRIGTAIFTIASVFCATAHDFPTLVAARTFQGAGAAAILASSQPIARFTFPAAMLGTAIGIQGMIVTSSSAAGPSIGGLILAIGSWPWLYWINVPFGIAVLALSGLLPELPRTPHKFDWTSAVLTGLTMALFITGIDQLRAPPNLTFFALEIVTALILGTIVVRRQATLDHPFLALDLLKIRVVRLSLVSGFVAFTAQNAALVTLPFYFRALGYAPAETGFLMTAFPVGMALIALASGRLSDRFHAGILGGIGLVLFGGSMALLALLPDHPTTFDVIWRTALGGFGFGLFASPNLRAMVGATPRHRSGAITGLTTTSRMTGTTMGVALTALIFSAGGASAAVGLGPMRLALWLALGLTLVSFAISSLRIESEPVSGP